MTPRLTILETRDCPSAVVINEYNDQLPYIPGFTEPVLESYGDVDGNGSVDRIVAAGMGGAPRVVIYSGGIQNADSVPSNSLPGTTKVPGSGDILYNGIVFAGSEDFRGGIGDIATVVRPGQSAVVVFIPGDGGGDRLVFGSFDTGAFVIEHSVSAFGDSNYRGDLHIQTTSYHPEFPAQNGVFGVDLIVTADAGPRAVVLGADGAQKASFFLAPDITDTRFYNVTTTDVDLPGQPQRRGVYFEVDGFRASSDWFGNQYSVRDAN